MARGFSDAPADGLPTETAGRYVGTLFDDHGARVYGLCRLLLHDPVEAEDAAQQTFLSAYRSLLSGHAPRNPPVWLSAIARNECRARMRARAAESFLPVAEAGAAGDDVEQIACRQEEIQVLCDALTELPEPQREAIVLREFYGLSYDEVGSASGLSPSAVKSVLFRARKRLKARLLTLRDVSMIAPSPLALREALAQVVPGFGSAEAGASSLAKLASIPLAAKVTGATMSVVAVGALGGAVVEAPDLLRPATAKPAAGAAAPAVPTAESRHAQPITLTAAVPKPRVRTAAGPPAQVPRAEDDREVTEAGEEAEEREAAPPELEREDGNQAVREDEQEHEESSEDD